jgi:hypothetical protein
VLQAVLLDEAFVLQLAGFLDVRRVNHAVLGHVFTLLAAILDNFARDGAL